MRYIIFIDEKRNGIFLIFSNDLDSIFDIFFLYQLVLRLITIYLFRIEVGRLKKILFS